MLTFVLLHSESGTQLRFKICDSIVQIFLCTYHYRFSFFVLKSLVRTAAGKTAVAKLPISGTEYYAEWWCLGELGKTRRMFVLFNFKIYIFEIPNLAFYFFIKNISSGNIFIFFWKLKIKQRFNFILKTIASFSPGSVRISARSSKPFGELIVLTMSTLLQNISCKAKILSHK